MAFATCPRCGRSIGQFGRASAAVYANHKTACDRLPAPADLATEYLADITNTVPSLAQKYGVDGNFTRNHLLHAGLTRHKINCRYFEARRVQASQAAEDRKTPPGGRPCRRCTILIFQDNPPYPCQQNIGGFCPDCWEERLTVVNDPPPMVQLEEI